MLIVEKNSKSISAEAYKTLRTNIQYSSFDKEIKIGDKLYFQDMAIYSMVKNNTFNGIPLPSIAVMDSNKDCRVIKSFGYKDFKGRL